MFIQPRLGTLELFGVTLVSDVCQVFLTSCHIIQLKVLISDCR